MQKSLLVAVFGLVVLVSAERKTSAERKKERLQESRLAARVLHRETNREDLKAERKQKREEDKEEKKGTDKKQILNDAVAIDEEEVEEPAPSGGPVRGGGPKRKEKEEDKEHFYMPKKVKLGEWENWTGWSECSQFCSPGMQFRTRTIRVEVMRGIFNTKHENQSQICNTDPSEWLYKVHLDPTILYIPHCFENYLIAMNSKLDPSNRNRFSVIMQLVTNLKSAA